MKKTSAEKLESLSPSGVCRMGEVDVTYYKRGKRLWFDRKHIEKVLTGKNQNNMLGQYKDPKNHDKIFDPDKKQSVFIISKAGVNNYLQKAWSVKEECRYAFYSGVKEIESPKESKVTEPLQMALADAATDSDAETISVSITQKGECTEIHSSLGGNDVVQFLLGVAQQIMTGKYQVSSI